MEFLDPPKYVTNRTKDKAHLFKDVVTDLRTSDSEICRVNYVNKLSAPNFMSHPHIHRGYYDSKKLGVLYVKSYTGVSIRKDESVLLSDGTFVSQFSDKLIKFTGSNKMDLIKAKINGWATKPPFEGCFTCTDRYSGIFEPVDISKLAVVVPLKSYGQIFRKTWLDYANGQGNIPSVVSQARYNSFKSTLNSAFLIWLRNSSSSLDNIQILPIEEVESKANCDKIPSGSDFLPNMYLQDHNREGVLALGDSCVLALHINNYHSSLSVYAPPVPINANAPVNDLVLDGVSIPNLEYNLPFKLVTINGALNVGSLPNIESKRTRNNEGDMLNYTAKVDKFKKSFLMTSAEKDRFDYKKEEHANRVKQYQEGKLKVPPKFPTLDEPIFMGIEIEVVPREAHRSNSGRSALVSKISNSSFGDHCIIKSDASIGDYGFEIVTIPATLNYHRDMFINHFFDKTNALHKDILATATCGIHVHISKKAFASKLELGRFITFINKPENAFFITDMSGRKGNDYCQKFVLKGKNEKGIDLSAKIAKSINMTGSTHAFNRKSAVNLCTPATVEIRIFKASNSKNNVIRKVEFCESLVHFASMSGNQDMTVEKYVDFVMQKDRCKDYPHLIRWLGSKNYVTHETKRVKECTKLIHIYSSNNVKNKLKQATS